MVFQFQTAGSYQAQAIPRTSISLPLDQPTSLRYKTAHGQAKRHSVFGPYA
jgi:hypothetical protein